MKRFNILSLILIVSLLTTVLVSCGGVDFKVNFVVGDDIYDSVATNGNETIKLPANPTKEGYEFEGWYWDNGEWKNPFTVNSLLNTPLAADMTVYAKFKHNEHSFDKETVVSPTCTDKGYTLKECECGETTKTDYVLTVEHTYSDFEVRTEATTYSVGLKERICTVCGSVDEEIIPQVSVSFGVTVIDPNLYIGEIAIPNLIPDNKYTPVPSPETLITEVNTEEYTLVVKAEDLPKDCYDDLKNIVADTFQKDNNIIINGIEIENVEDFIIYIEDENGDLIPVPWQ